MRKVLLIAAGLTCLGHAVSAQEEIAVPSGQKVTFIDVIRDAPGPDGLTYRFRFLAPEIARAKARISGDAAQEDMTALCTTYVLPRLANAGPVPNQIIVSLSDRVVPFGAPDPAATQYFSGYTVQDGTCEWDGF